MQKLSPEFYRAAIKTVFPDATDITLPSVPGKVACVFKFQTNDGPRVCRFNEKSVIFRNQKVTKLLYDYGAIIKPTQPHVYLGQYFESYEYDPHPTFQETIKDMSRSEIVDTYKSAMCAQAYLASFPTQHFDNLDNMHFMDVYNVTMPHYVKNGVMQYLYRLLYKHFSSNKNMYIMHNDLTPANMLVADDRHSVVRLIDFDAISICNENMAIFGMLRRYPFADKNMIIEYYQDITGHSLNRGEIMGMLNLFTKTLDFRKTANTFTFRNAFKQH